MLYLPMTTFIILIVVCSIYAGVLYGKRVAPSSAKMAHDCAIDARQTWMCSNCLGVPHDAATGLGTSISCHAKGCHREYAIYELYQTHLCFIIEDIFFLVRVYLMSHRYCSNCVSGVGGILPDHLSGCMWCTICVVCDTVPAKWVGYGLCKKCHGWMCGDCNKKSHDSICNSALCVPKSKK